MTLTKLMKSTPDKVIEASKKIRLLSIKRNKKTGEYNAIAQSVEPGSKVSKKHKLKIKFKNLNDFNKGKNFFNSDVMVYCDCEYFMYYLEVALSKKGISEVLLSNGKLPIEKNPMMKTYLCKHLYKLALYLYNKL